MKQQRFACQSDQDCKPGHVCINNVCMAPCPGGARDVDTDVNNCGSCGNVCPTPVHAATACRDGGCTRGPCEAGYFDLNPGVFGCEVTCSNHVCTFPDGGTVAVTADPVPDTGLVQKAFASGSSFGGAVQTSATNTNVGVLGESSPPAIDGGVFQRSAININVGGFFVVSEH